MSSAYSPLWYLLTTVNCSLWARNRQQRWCFNMMLLVNTLWLWSFCMICRLPTNSAGGVSAYCSWWIFCDCGASVRSAVCLQAALVVCQHSVPGEDFVIVEFLWSAVCCPAVFQQGITLLPVSTAVFIPTGSNTHCHLPKCSTSSSVSRILF